MTIKEYREFVSTHLHLIKQKVDENNEHLIRVNGRLNKAESNISLIKGIGSGVAFIATFVVSVLYFIKG